MDQSQLFGAADVIADRVASADSLRISRYDAAMERIAPTGL